MSNTMMRHCAVLKARKALRHTSQRHQQAQDAQKRREAAVAQALEKRAQIKPRIAVVSNPLTGHTGGG